MDWVSGFYSRTGTWWGDADGRVRERDHRRAALVAEYGGAGPLRVLELGSGYGTTAVAMAQAGHEVVAVEVSDRADRTADLAEGVGPGSVTLVRDDFYAASLAGRFDVVSYWNGFGVGSDDDQRRLLRRVAAEWLRPDGVALIDVFNPFGWWSLHGTVNRRLPSPERGYAYELYERITFDPVTCTATDCWWPAATPDDAISQVLRCYTPADLRLLLDGTGLTLAGTVGELTAEEAEYLAVLRTSN